MYTKIKAKHERADNPDSDKQNVTLFTQLFFSGTKKNDTENASETSHHTGSHGQTKNMQCYTGVTFSGIHNNKMHRDKPSRKKTEITSHSHTTRGFCMSQ